MKKKLSLLLVLLFSLNLCFISCDFRSAEDTQAAFDEFVNDVFKESFEDDSLSTHFYLEHPEKYDINQKEITLGHYKSDASMEEDYEEEIKEIESYDYDKLTDKQQILYDKILYLYKVSAEYKDCTDLSTSLGRNKSIIANSVSNFMEYSFAEEKDITEYMTLLKQLPAYYDEAIKFAKDQMDKGVIPTDTALDTNITYCNNYSTEKDNVFLISFNDKIDEMIGLTDAKKEEYKKQNKDIVDNTIIPKYKEMSKTITELKGSNKDPRGLANIDGGKEYYEALCKSITGSSKTPDELLSTIESKIQGLIKEIYTMSTSDPDLFNKISNMQVAYNTPDKALEHLKTQIKTNYPELSDVNYKAKYLPKPLEIDGVVAYYLSPQIDNPNNNVIKVNESAVSSDSLSLFTSLAHEGYPGHLFQRNYYRETNPYPVEYLFSYLGYTEGWATFAEIDSYNMCDISNDKLIRLLQINNLLNNYLTCAIDIQVNYNNYDLSKVQNYLAQYYGSSQGKTIAETLYDFVISDPCTMLSYGVGYIELTDIQEEYKESAGSDYNEKDFIKKVLDIGPCSFDTLKKYVIK